MCSCSYDTEIMGYLTWGGVSATAEGATIRTAQHSASTTIFAYVSVESEFIHFKSITMCPTWFSHQQNLMNTSFTKALHPFISLNHVSMLSSPF